MHAHLDNGAEPGRLVGYVQPAGDCRTIFPMWSVVLITNSAEAAYGPAQVPLQR